MVLSVGLGTGYTYVVKNNPNWIPLIDIEDLITPQTLVNLIGRLDKLEYNVIVSNNDELKKLMKGRGIEFITVVKENSGEPVKVSVGKNFILEKDKFLKDFLQEIKIT